MKNIRKGYIRKIKKRRKAEWRRHHAINKFCGGCSCWVWYRSPEMKDWQRNEGIDRKARILLTIRRTRHPFADTQFLKRTRTEQVSLFRYTLHSEKDVLTAVPGEEAPKERKGENGELDVERAEAVLNERQRGHFHQIAEAVRERMVGLFGGSQRRKQGTSMVEKDQALATIGDREW